MNCYVTTCECRITSWEHSCPDSLDGTSTLSSTQLQCSCIVPPGLYIPVVKHGLTGPRKPDTDTMEVLGETVSRWIWVRDDPELQKSRLLSRYMVTLIDNPKGYLSVGWISLRYPLAPMTGTVLFVPIRYLPIIACGNGLTQELTELLS